MPIINVYLKFALIALGFILGIFLTIAYGFWYGFPFMLLGIVMLVSYFLLGTVQSAGELVQDQKFDEAKQRLSMTKFPRFLYVTNRAIYYILNGSIDAAQGNNKGAEDYFNKALTLDLPSDNEKAMVYLQLANINASKNNWNASMSYFNQAKKLDVTMPQIKEQITMFNKAMKQRGTAKVAQQSMGGRKGGGNPLGGRSSKRRRPKMR